MSRGQFKKKKENLSEILWGAFQAYPTSSRGGTSHEDVWNTRVSSRLTGANSEWALSENEYDPEIIFNNITSLETQHKNYQTNNPKRYEAGKAAFDATEKALADQRLQYTRALNFQKEYNELLKSNDVNVVKKAVPLFDENNNPIYDKVVKPDGTVDFDYDADLNKIQSTRMMSNWDVLLDDISKTSERDEYGTIIFSDKSRTMIENMKTGNEGIADRLFEFKRKYADWIGLADMNGTLANMDYLLKESNKNILSLDDTLGGGLVLNRQDMEDFALALETDTIDDYKAGKQFDREIQQQGAKNLMRERDKFLPDYLKYRSFVNPGHGGVTRAPDQGDGIVRYDDSIYQDGEWIADYKTAEEMRNKYLPQLFNVISKIAPLDLMLENKYGVMNTSFLLGNDKRYIDPNVLRREKEEGAPAFTPDGVTEYFPDDEAYDYKGPSGMEPSAEDVSKLIKLPGQETITQTTEEAMKDYAKSAEGGLKLDMDALYAPTEIISPDFYDKEFDKLMEGMATNKYRGQMKSKLSKDYRDFQNKLPKIKSILDRAIAGHTDIKNAYIFLPHHLQKEYDVKWKELFQDKEKDLKRDKDYAKKMWDLRKKAGKQIAKDIKKNIDNMTDIKTWFERLDNQVKRDYVIESEFLSKKRGEMK